MSGMEVVAVIGCVAAVVSAYKDGARIVQQIKQRRAARRALPPTALLENSLQKGPVDVEKARDEGIERYGPGFGDGDSIAIGALKDIIIHLQMVLLRNLWVAQEDDSMTDFTILVDASDIGRKRSVIVLDELYMRMAQAAPVQRALPPPGSPPAVSPGRINTLETVSSLGMPLVEVNHGSNDAVSHPPTSLTTHSQRHSNTGTPSNPPTPSKKWSIFLSLKSKRDSTASFQSIPESQVDTEGQSTAISSRRGSFSNSGPSPPDASSSVGPWTRSPQMTIDEDNDEDNPWKSEFSTSNRSSVTRSPVARPDQAASQQQLSPHRAPGTHDPTVDERQAESSNMNGVRRTRLPLPHAFSDSATKASTEADLVARGLKAPAWKPWRRASSGTGPSTNIPTSPQGVRQKSRRSSIVSSSHSIPPIASNAPTGEPYDGYCKGAYKLKVGLEGFALRDQSISMGGKSMYFACSKCGFEGPASNINKSWTFDNKIRQYKSVQYRWTFLAKSHSKVKGRGEYNYKCMFCEKGSAASEVHRSEKAFIEHVSSQHKEQDPASLTTNRICYIIGRKAAEGELFDVNILPDDDRIS